MRMGKKNTVNRLPKAERTEPTTKITVRPVARMPHPMEPSFPHQPTTPRTPVPTLDNESLSKILRLAGMSTTLRARSVNQQWRHVAANILNDVHHIQLSRLFPNIPTSAIVHSTLKAFPHLEGISVRNWPYTHVYPCIVDELNLVDLPYLKEVVLLGVHVTPRAIGLLVQKQSVRFVTLGNHDSINRAVVSAIAKSQITTRGNNRINSNGHPKYLLDRLVFKRARCMEGHEVSTVSKLNVAREVVVIECPNIRDTVLSCISPSTSRRQKTYEMYSLTNCRNLQHLTVNMSLTSNDCSHLNFSQCTQLKLLDFTVENAASYETGTILLSDLRELNLSGCRELLEIVVQQNEPVGIMFLRVEMLVLYGARRLRRSCIQGIFGLSGPIPLLPRLIRLDLNGTTIDKLVLNDYTQLRWVDVSGCPSLQSIDVRECWRLENFSVLGKRAPLNTVVMVLPVTCKVEGRRDAWHWQIHESHLAISYP